MVADHRRDGLRVQIRTPGDLQTIELVKANRLPPGSGQIEVAVNASSVKFADVLAAFGRYPSSTDNSLGWAWISPAWWLPSGPTSPNTGSGTTSAAYAGRLLETSSPATPRWPWRCRPV